MRVLSSVEITVVLLVAFGIAGCSKSEDKITTVKVKTKEKKTSNISLELGGWDKILELVKSHKGKVVVVDLWSNFCGPCKREFPNLVNIHKTMEDQVACLSFNLDYEGIKGQPAESYREAVMAFLEKQDAQFQHVFSNVLPEVIYNKLEIASIPVVYVFDQTGKIAKRFDNEQADKPEKEFTYQKDIIPFIESLLKK